MGGLQHLRSLTLHAGTSIEIYTGKYTFAGILAYAQYYDTTDVRGERRNGSPYAYVLTRVDALAKLARYSKRHNLDGCEAADLEYMAGRERPPLPENLTGVRVYEALVHRKSLQKSNGE